MEQKYLIINSGSASHKHALYQGTERVYFIHYEMVAEKYIAHETIGNAKHDLYLTEKIFNQSIEYTVSRLLENKVIKSKKEIARIGIRVVAPGIYFQKNRMITAEYEKILKRDESESPLHIKSELQAIKFIRKVLPRIAIVGVSDSAFHSTLSEPAKHYGLPLAISKKYGIYKYGYHGLSIQSVVARVTARYSQLPAKVVVCHLGSGSSITAVLNGKSVDTTMGFTPLDGLVMATRIGSIDAGAVAYLSEKLKKGGGELMDFFNKECGLLGLSNNRSSDIRELLKAEIRGDASAKLALDIYADRVKKYIAQAVGVMGGIDLLVFAGTVGERSYPMRRRICDNMEFFGIKLDHDLNNKTEGVENEISTFDSNTKIVVIKTDEMGEIAKITANAI